MIYIDSSVALSRLLLEPRAPPLEFWQAPLVSSRLLEYEVWNRVHAHGLMGSHGDQARSLLIGIELLEMEKSLLARALEPWPITIRTLDALHLATVEHLRSLGGSIELASYDSRLLAAAHALGIAAAEL